MLIRTTDYDVIIVGAGPAGCSCARALHSGGAKVLLLDKHVFPRYKACGGLVADRAQELLKKTFGPVPEKITCSTPVISTMLSRNGNSYIQLGQSYLNVHRHLFDYWLSQNCNVPVTQKCTFHQFSCEKETVQVSVSINKRPHTYICKYLIGADGGNSMVRRGLDSRFGKDRFYFVQFIYKGQINLEPDRYYFLIGSNFTDLLACFCIKDGFIYAGTTYKNRSKGLIYLKNLLAYLEEKFKFRSYEKIRGEGCSFGLSLNRKLLLPGKDNILLAGESAGLISSLGEGIPSALISGKMAADSILSADQSNPAITLYSGILQDEINLLKKSYNLRY